ncbi:hypothetical protein DUI87_22222 [Hirundo rustica rustica]|uniref:Uncharacterized protein n=1 Tax=Hirundo rustica rustica TaxID=333673 RepID=A0A3M0JK07_HIRRU|nr:hypothetical protein DUI87_22222 [Hirundo rustica rustica]
MSPTLAFILALLATHTGLKVNLNIEKDEVQQMQEREEYLHQEMTQLLQEIEGSSGIMESLLYCAWQQQRLLWVTAAALALVLLSMGCWLLRRRKHASASCKEQEGSYRKENAVSKEKVSNGKFGYENANSKEKVSSQKKGGSREISSEEKVSREELRLSKGLHLSDADWTFISVNPEEQGAWSAVKGFKLQEDRVQRMPPWRYLGLEIGKQTIVRQKLDIKVKVKLWLRGITRTSKGSSINSKGIEQAFHDATAPLNLLQEPSHLLMMMIFFTLLHLLNFILFSIEI